MNFGNVWDSLVDAVCRPPRDATYTIADLLGGQSGDVAIGAATGKREDVQVKNKHNLTIELSIYWPTHIQAKPQGRPCVIYCHSNSGSRRAAEEAVYLLLSAGFAVAAPDFTGSGLSEGEWVTLGMREADDVEAIVHYLRQSGKVSTIGLWGRSMGAVTALMYASRDPEIAGLVLDSPFSRLTELMTEVSVTLNLPIPMKIFANSVISGIRKSVQRKAEFDIEQLAPIDVVPGCEMPALFGHASNDDFIKMAHSIKLYEAYAGAKDIITFDGGHLSIRPVFFYYAVLAFFCKALDLDSNLESAPPMDRRKAEQSASLTCQLLEGRYAGLPLDEVFLEIQRKSVLVTMPSGLHTGELFEDDPTLSGATLLPMSAAGQTLTPTALLQSMAEVQESALPFPSDAVRSARSDASDIMSADAHTPSSAHELPTMSHLKTLRIPDRSNNEITADQSTHDHTRRSWGTGSDHSGGGGAVPVKARSYHRTSSASSSSASGRGYARSRGSQQQYDDGGIDGDSVPPTPTSNRSSRSGGTRYQGMSRGGIVAQPTPQGKSEVYRLYKNRQTGRVSMQLDTSGADSTGPWFFHSTARTPRGTVAICEYSGSHPNKKYRIRRLAPQDELPVLNSDAGPSSGGMYRSQTSSDSMTWSAGGQSAEQRRHQSASSNIQPGNSSTLRPRRTSDHSMNDQNPSGSHVLAPKPPAGLPPSVKNHMHNSFLGPIQASSQLETGDNYMMPGCLGPIGPTIKTHSPRGKDQEGIDKKDGIKWKQHATGTTPYGGLVCEVSGMLLRRKYRWRLLLASGGSVEVPGAVTSTVPSLEQVEALYHQLQAIGKNAGEPAEERLSPESTAASEAAKVKLYSIPGKPGIQVTGEVLNLYKSLDPSTLNGLVKMYIKDKTVPDQQ